jgi:hypothetical protein
MAKRKRGLSDAAIQRRIRQGYGQGIGTEYTPWHRIQDVPSSGLVFRIMGLKTGRTHHFLSRLEAHYFYIVEWSEDVIDIREQYPLLPREMTQQLADRCGIRHPIDPRTRIPWVMTTDFLITTKGCYRPVELARNVKPSNRTTNHRVLEKMEIERQYWLMRRTDWGVVTENEIPMDLARNLEFLRCYADMTSRMCDLSVSLDDVIDRINSLATSSPYEPLHAIARACDAELGVTLGTGLSVAYHLLYTRRWLTNLMLPLNPALPLVDLRIREWE